MNARGNTPLIAAIVLALGLGLAGCTEPSASPTPSARSNEQAGAVDSLVQAGVEAAGRGDFASAKTTFQNVLMLDPKNKYAHYNLGIMAQAQGDYTAAMDGYDKAISADVKFTPALYNKAILIEVSDPAGAVQLYEKIVGIDAKASTAYLRMSVLYAAQGLGDKAAEARKKAADLDPSFATATPEPAPNQ
jgi:Tfp pilus assembly protein PilF